VPDGVSSTTALHYTHLASDQPRSAADEISNEIATSLPKLLEPTELETSRLHMMK